MTLPTQPRQLRVADVLRAASAGGDGDLPGVYSARQRGVARHIMDCRTEELGGTLYGCDACGRHVPVYHSCRDRHCPTCQARARAQWVTDRTKEILPVKYFHMVFTLPAQLRPFALRNKKEVYAMLFKAVSETLLALGADPDHLGGRLGFIAVLHTWTQKLMDHPHIHCLIPAGAMGHDGLEWLQTKGDYLFPIEVVKRLYRGKFMALFREAVTTGEVGFHGLLKEQERAFPQLVDELYKTPWVVYTKPPHDSPERVVKYLASYTNRIAIADSRIKKIEGGSVTFSYRDRTDNDKEKLLTLSIAEFVRRFLLHVLPKGFTRIRYYGFMANRERTSNVERSRQAIQGPPTGDIFTEVEPQLNEQPNTHEGGRCCPFCGKGTLHYYADISPTQQKRGYLKAA